jgi:hypothetical protein
LREEIGERPLVDAVTLQVPDQCVDPAAAPEQCAVDAEGGYAKHPVRNRVSGLAGQLPQERRVRTACAPAASILASAFVASQPYGLTGSK